MVTVIYLWLLFAQCQYRYGPKAADHWQRYQPVDSKWKFALRVHVKCVAWEGEYICVKV